MTHDWLAAFIIGLIGTTHCLGMCGGIASMLSIGQPSQRSFLIPLLYNLGRLSCYTFIGAIVGGSVSSLLELSQMSNILIWLRLVAALFMVLLALYIGRWWHGLLLIEKVGQRLWRHISPLATSLLPIKKPIYALPFGFVWGWLPCGLVYSMLTWSAVAGNALNGGLIMLAFGLGTLPAMLMIAMSINWLQRWVKSDKFRLLCAVTILLYAMYTLFATLKLLKLTA
ncbi:cytochrome biogenesis protein [Vibrio sp. 10N.286.49.B3]|uniref:sulfite exporter TauE/SafE family protein n=1 Tax=Vibrio sp. 10N.286.49.B3 TaxID=1880855 RepID=UPI000C855A7F|nr:sulfite exporter TauE/SafE family protein [Vibrio sp. 10N.286.49.B3]PMH46518.1 cytochrome biogenesis protein [Vibrio sp. 10N.286.49.B3]